MRNALGNLVDRLRSRAAGVRRSFNTNRGGRSLAQRIRGAARYAVSGAGRGG